MHKLSPTLTAWLNQQLNSSNWCLTERFADASQRYYQRLQCNHESKILMVSPPNQEPIDTFIKINQQLITAGLHAPVIHAIDHTQGWLLLDDFGNQHLHQALSKEHANEHFYIKAMQTIIDMQKRLNVDTLPEYDEKQLRNELGLFKTWYLEKLKKIELTRQQQQQLKDCYNWLIDNALSQPKAFTHRDFHSKNLMLLPNQNIGILDFQDAVKGPFTYDLASLIFDCYLPSEMQPSKSRILAFYQQALLQLGIKPVKESTMLKWTLGIAIQRHLKAIGIFARLSIRDQKHKHLQYIPNTLKHIELISQAYPISLQPLLKILEISS